MNDLHFNDQSGEFGRPNVTPQGSDFSSKLIQWGLVSDRTQAQYVLIGIGVVALIAAFLIFRSL